MSAVSVKGLGHRYGAREALSDLSFEVAPGVLFGLLGPNGSGKTTLFRILATLFPPSSGTAFILGSELRTAAAEVRRKIGVVFQSSSLDLKLTAYENLRHQGHLYGLSGSRLQQRIAAVLERAGLQDRVRERVEAFSGGLRRRLEVAKGLLHEPALLLLDEPSAGLDPGARRELSDQLRGLARDGITILLTTHLMEEAERCDELLFLDQGRSVALGPPDALRRELGGDVLSLTTRDAPALASWLEREAGASRVTVLDGLVRVEEAAGLDLARRVAAEFPGTIEQLTLGRPTLEDVFIRRTGRRFHKELAP